MIENIYRLSVNNEKTIEKVLFDENVNFIHMVFNKGEGAPEHLSNANIYLTIIRGTLSINLGEQETHEYQAGTLLKIPSGVNMNIRNLYDDTLELIIVKSPIPK